VKAHIPRGHGRSARLHELRVHDVPVRVLEVDEREAALVWIRGRERAEELLAWSRSLDQQVLTYNEWRAQA
jgi:hypothetical protein